MIGKFVSDAFTFLNLKVSVGVCFDFVHNLQFGCLQVTVGVPDVSAQYTKRSVVFVINPTNKSRPCGGVGFGVWEGIGHTLLPAGSAPL